MPKLSDLIKRFKQSQFGQQLMYNFGTPDETTPVDAREMEPGVLAQLGERLRGQYQALAGPESPWGRGDFPGMVHQGASILNPIEGRNVAENITSGSPAGAGLSMVPYFGGPMNEMAVAQGQGRPNEATAIGLEQLLNIAAIHGAAKLPGAVRAVGDMPTVDVTGAPVSFRQLLASEHGMVPIGVDPYKGTVESAIKSARNPKEAFEARIRQVGKRKPGVGAPKNPRIEFRAIEPGQVQRFLTKLGYLGPYDRCKYDVIYFQEDGREKAMVVWGLVE